MRGVLGGGMTSGREGRRGRCWWVCGREKVGCSCAVKGGSVGFVAWQGFELWRGKVTGPPLSLGLGRIGARGNKESAHPEKDQS